MGGMVRVTNSEAIDLLEQSKHDHYVEPEGLDNCEGWTYVKDHYELTGPCTCGASEANERIEAVIQHLRTYLP